MPESYKFIKLDIDQNVAKITLNHPDVLNSFNKPMAKEFQHAFTTFAGPDPEKAYNRHIRAVLITGEGRAFCAGQDLAEAAPKDASWPNIRTIVKESYSPMIKAMRKLEKPVVCAVNGIAAGAGANVALAGDIVVASEKAGFLQAFIHIGLVPDSGGTYFLPRLAGLHRAAAMMMLGEKISAQEAQEIGMIYKVFPPDKFAEEAMNLVLHLAKMPTKALGLTKRALNKSFENDLETQLTLEEDLQGVAGGTQDYEEGVKAFLEKRKAEFIGR